MAAHSFLQLFEKGSPARADLFLRLFETILPPGNWHTLAIGTGSTSGVHAYGPDDHDIPAGDVWPVNWEPYAAWHAFPGRQGNGTDCDEEMLTQIDSIYQGHRCCHVFQHSRSSSFHAQFGNFAILIDLSREADEALQDISWGLFSFKGFERNGPQLDQVDEFMYPGWRELTSIAEDRGELDHTEMPGPEHYSKPKPGETSQGYWNRRTNAAAASDQWTKKRDGD